MRKFKLFVFVIITFLFLFCSGEPDDEPGFSGITPVTIPADFAGMCHAGYSGNIEREYPMLNEMGVTWLHRDFTWNVINPSEDTWNFSGYDGFVERANSENKKIMGMLLYNASWVTTERRIKAEDIPRFTKYAVETTKRYNGKNGYGKVDAWLIWNEPDITRFWTGTPEEYFELVRATAEAVRELDAEQGTHTMLLGGVFTSTVTEAWITGLFEHQNGVIKGLIDGIAFHPYGPNPLSSTGVFNWFKEKVAPYGFADKIWLNEMGYPTYLDKGAIPSGRYGTDQWEGDMPRVVTQTLTLLATAGARNLTWYHLFDGASRNNNDSESWFGLVWRKSDDEWERKGGYWAYTLCANHLPGKTYKEFKGSGIPKNVETYYFEGSDGSRTLVLWNEDPFTAAQVRINFGSSNHRLWNLETGGSESAEKNSTYTLYPLYGDPGQNVLFFTWEE